MKYELNDKPGMLPMLMYGLQWWIVSLPCVVIMGIIVSQLHYTNVSEQTFYLQKLFGIMGIVMIVQVLWGHRLPLIIGPASVLLIGILSTVSSGIPAVYTGIMVGGLVLTVLAYSGLLGKLQFVFTPRIVTVILILIAFTLTPVILKLVLGDAVHALFNLFLTLVMVLALVIGNKLLRGIWKSTTVLWGIVGGVLVTIPGVVMGAILLYLMATQLAAGLQMLVREKAITDFDSGVVVGLPLMVALLLSFAPEEVLNLIPSLFKPIVGNGFVMGVITVLIMEHLIFKKK